MTHRSKDESPRPRRVTIADIARRASVAPSTVSFALNDRPGVGEVTRRRILSIASEMGWRPNSAARALRAARSKTVGMVLQWRHAPFGEEQSSFLLNLITGIDTELSLDGFALLLHTVPDLQAETATYESWWVERRVDGVVLYNPRVDDPRLAQLLHLGLPAVVMGAIEHEHRLASVWTDNLKAASLVVNHLVGIGHRRIARLGVDSTRLYAAERRRGFELAMAAAGLPSDLSVEAGGQVERTTLDLLRRPDPPTAIIFEADTLAIQGMLALRQHGISIPEDLSVVAWDDCTTYRLFSPALTALHRDIPALGQTVAKTLVKYLNTGHVDHLRGASSELVVRESTGSPRHCSPD